MCFKTEMQQPYNVPKRLPNKNASLDNTNKGFSGVKVKFGLLYSCTKTIIVFIVIYLFSTEKNKKVNSKKVK